MTKAQVIKLDCEKIEQDVFEMKTAYFCHSHINLTMRSHDDSKKFQ